MATQLSVCGVLFNAFDGVQPCGRIRGHKGAHTRDPIGRERQVMEAGAKATAEARIAAQELKSHAD